MSKRRSPIELKTAVQIKRVSHLIEEYAELLRLRKAIEEATPTRSAQTNEAAEK